MSWQLASFLVLGAVLIGGFAWYERSRPPSQVVALVAALAALAIAGRIAFAAIPNVKPTTDITIFAGYALGPAPGFAVGALTALVSNFWFGQGPWTPWQMAGWGMCGIFGAALALGGHRLGRLPLALACGFAGIAYGALLNFSLMATYGGDLSLQRFLVLESRAVPFDAAHAIANVALALVAGPAMVRMLSRFRERFEWRAAAVAATLAFALIALPAAMPAPARAAGLQSAENWLLSAQNADGGFGADLGEKSSTAISGWAMLGLEAAGRNPLDVASAAGRTPIDFLKANVGDLQSSGDLARTIVALEGAGVNPHSFAGRNLVAALADRRRKDGSFEDWPGTTAFSVIALRSAGATGGLDSSLAWLASVQNDDGGWGDTAESESNADVTSLVMQAMASSKNADRALGYLRKVQRSNGGFALGASGEVNSQSTAWAAQGMTAVGTDPATVGKGGNSALDYLAKRQAPDGHYEYSAAKDETPVWVTAQALVPVAGKSFPIPPPPRAPKPAPPFSGSGSSPLPAPSASGVPPVLPQLPATPPAPEAGAVGGGPSGGNAPPPPVTGKGSVPKAPKTPQSAPPASPAPSSSGPLPAIDSDNAASPWAPLGVGLAAGALALASVVWLGRRYGW